MALEPARHMVTQNAALKVDPDPAHEAASTTDSPGSTALVLNGVLQLTNNIDPSQPAPDDQPQAVFRHVSVQIRDADAGKPIPYLSTSLDLLLDGRGVMSNVPLEPMVAAESTTPELYYGNNLEFMKRGSYQVFVRLQPSALLGKAAPPAAQFTVVLH
jgi:Fe2+ transport protein